MDNKLASTVIKQQHQPQPQHLILTIPKSPHQEQAHHNHHNHNHHHQEQQQQETLSEQNNNNENFSHQAAAQTAPPNLPPPSITQPSPKVTVSLPKHVASRLRELVQRRDIALLRLGIISVQFEGDQTIPLTLHTTTNSNHQTKQQLQPITSSESIIEPSIENCNVDYISNPQKTITAATAPTTTTLTCPNPPNGPIFEEREKKEENEREGSESSKISTSIRSIIDSSSSIANNIITTTTAIVSTIPATTTTTTTTTGAQSNVQIKTECNTVDSLAAVYDDDDKDEEEVVNEVENQHSSSYNIHQLSQLEFADPIELEMYDNDNLLFPDYTLNLS